MDSPEVWFEDFGAAKLNGVFVTPDCRGFIASAPGASRWASLPGASLAMRFPIALLPGARTSEVTRASRRPTRLAKMDKPLPLPTAATRARHAREHGAGERRRGGAAPIVR